MMINENWTFPSSIYKVIVYADDIHLQDIVVEQLMLQPAAEFSTWSCFPNYKFLQNISKEKGQFSFIFVSY